MKPGTVNRLLHLMQQSSVSLFQHSANVANLALRIYMSAYPQKTDREALIIGALLHDLGKIFIKEGIIDKPGPLTKSERQEIRRHPLLGSAYVAKEEGSDPAVVQTIRYHHERWDGKGYEGLTGEEIPLFARIVAIADALDAMTSLRPYRLPLNLYEAFEEINQGNGTQFDPQLIAALGQKPFWKAETYCNSLKIELQIINEKHWFNTLLYLPSAFACLLAYAQSQWMGRLYAATEQHRYKNAGTGRMV